ncbi:aromatic amino acid lyase [Streptomyces sp. NPDC006622]|uniref:aromatic amino acid ammonia-lyase n=1 Tax=Streptomyces sp. NPDC006622 TaxID=3155459 RepID=UPI0033B92F14
MDTTASPVVLNGTTLTVGGLIALADGAAVPVTAPEARERAVRSFHAGRRLAATGRLYGRGTGVGAHRAVSVDADDETAHGLRVLRSHAGGAGALLPARQIRAMLAIRANQLLAGGSGIHPGFVDALVEALRLGVHPAVNEYGSVGTGDLTALAQTGLTLLGERPWLDSRPNDPDGADGPTRTGSAPESRPGGGYVAIVGGGGDVPADRGPSDGGSPPADGGSESRPAGTDPASRNPCAPPTELTGGDCAPRGGAPGVRPAGAGTARDGGSPSAGTAAVGVPARGGRSPARQTHAARSGPGSRPLPAPVVLRPGDALALLSSNALALGQAALGWHEVDRSLRATHAVAALALAAVSGSAEAYAAPVHDLRPYPGAVRAAGEVRRLLGLPDRPEGSGRRIQDPYGFRAFPQVHGCALDAAERLREVVEVEINCPSENPLLALDGTAAHHHGGFFAAPLGHALEAVNLTLLQTAQLSAARLAALGDPGLTGLSAFLAAGPASSSGTMILEYTANSALAELRACAAPASVGHAVLSHGLEEAASFAGQAARQTLRAARAYRTVLGCELVAAVRAARMHPVPPSVAAFTVAAAALPDGTDDRPLTGDVTAAAELLPLLAQL